MNHANCACSEIHAALDLAQPTISKHLRILEEAGLVDRRKDGQFVIYFLPSFAPGSPCLPVLSEVLVWAGRSPEIRELLERLVHIDRYAICKQRRSNEDA